MAKRKPDTGAIYISPRLRASLEPVGRCALTVVTAPMGYGKTTAVNWFLGTQPPGCAIRISIYSDSLPALWQSGRRAFRDAGLTALEGFECPGDPASAGLLADTLCRELRRQEPWYVFLDDLHLMPDRRVAHFLCELAARLPDNVHLIAASRDKALSGDQVLRLGGRLHRIGAGQLRLEGDELAAYAHRFGAALDREQLAELQQATEGWMAAVYLHLQALADRGTAPAETADIYDMFTAAMLRPLPPHLRGEESDLCARLAPDKDVDGMTPESAAAVFTGQGRGFAPCTAQACMALLRHYGIAPCGRHAVVIGRSPVVGRPVSMLLLRENATVTVCHTKTPDTAALTRQADIIITAAGAVNSLTAAHVRPGQTVLDVSMNWNGTALCGDADFPAVSSIVDAITPVPGGVGAVTSAVLMAHTVRAAEYLTGEGGA